MPECRIVCTIVGSSNLPREAVAYCETHQFEIRGPVNHASLCPIGRIEQATDSLLNRLGKLSMPEPEYENVAVPFELKVAEYLSEMHTLDPSPAAYIGDAKRLISIIESALLREMANELAELDADAAWQTWLNAFARERGLLEGECPDART